VATPAPRAQEKQAELDDRLLASAPLATMQRPEATQAGPVLLELQPADTYSGLSISLTVNVPAEKEFEDAAVSVIIGRVLDRAGGEIYNAAADSEMSERVWLKPASFPVKHLYGPRPVRVKAAKNFASVDGVVKLAFPAKRRTISLGATDVGKAQTVHGVEIVLKSLAGNYANFQLGGDTERVVSAAGFGADQKLLDAQGLGGPAASRSYRFGGPVSRVELSVAETAVKREFPFTLTRQGIAPATTPAVTAMIDPKTAAVAPAPIMAVRAPALPGPIQARTAAALPGAIEPLPPGRSTSGPKYNDLMSAVMSSDVAALNELLAMGKWPDKPDSNGMTPLTAAAMRGDRASVEVLVKAGADSDRALAVARMRRDAAMTSLLERYATSERP
jgi:hypothetical protein